MRSGVEFHLQLFIDVILKNCSKNIYCRSLIRLHFSYLIWIFKGKWSIFFFFDSVSSAQYEIELLLWINKTSPFRVTLITIRNKEYNVCSSVANHEVPQVDGTTGIKHCHDNSHAQEDREREKKSARKRLYVASVVCLIFMIGEILGELCHCFFSLHP